MAHLTRGGALRVRMKGTTIYISDDVLNVPHEGRSNRAYYVECNHDRGSGSPRLPSGMESSARLFCLFPAKADSKLEGLGAKTSLLCTPRKTVIQKKLYAPKVKSDLN